MMADQIKTVPKFQFSGSGFKLTTTSEAARPKDEPVELEPLGLADKKLLVKLEAKIQTGLHHFFEVGSALNTIFELKLYREKYHTFREYCRAEWDFTERRALQFRSAAEVVKALEETGTIVLPQTESQARELGRLPKGQQAAVWKEAVAATNGKPTAKAVREKAQGAAPKKRWPECNSHGVYADDEKAVEVFELRKKAGHCIIRILQVGDSAWVHGYQYAHLKGTMAAGSGALRKTWKSSTREAAIQHIGKEIREVHASMAKSVSTPGQKEFCKSVVDWAHKLLSDNPETRVTGSEKGDDPGFDFCSLHGGKWSQPAQAPKTKPEKQNLAEERWIEVLAAEIHQIAGRAMAEQQGAKHWNIGDWRDVDIMRRAGFLAIARWHMQKLKEGRAK